MGITIHWIENGQMKDVGLALVPLKGSHSGENMFEAFVKIVYEEFGLLHKVCNIRTISLAIFV